MDNFIQGLQVFRQVCEQKATKRLRRIAMKALELVVVGTPVLTGCCRGNWQVSIDSLQKTFDKKKTDKNGSETIKAGLVRIKSVKLGNDVLIENSCPYAMRLENGWSRQKPAGSMIREPLEKLRNAIKNGAM